MSRAESMRRGLRRAVAAGIALSLFAVVLVLGCQRKVEPPPPSPDVSVADVTLNSDRVRIINGAYNVDTGTTWLFRKKKTTLQFDNRAQGQALVWFVDSPAGEVIEPGRPSRQYVVADSAELRSYKYRIYKKENGRWVNVPHQGPTEPQVVAGD